MLQNVLVEMKNRQVRVKPATIKAGRLPDPWLLPPYPGAAFSFRPSVCAERACAMPVIGVGFGHIPALTPERESFPSQEQNHESKSAP